MSRMHNELPPPDLGRAVIMHRSRTEPDAAKALTHMREARDAVDAFIEDFGAKSNHAVAYMRDPDHNLIGETMALEYWATAIANRLDLVIADLERNAAK
jgi:hypothetical protein